MTDTASLEGSLCNKVVNSLDEEIIVLNGQGHVSFANRRARDTLGEIEPDQPLSKLFVGLENGVGERLRRIAQSSIWAPINLTLGDGPHRGVSLKFRGRGFVGDDGVQQIMLVASRDRDKGFEQLRSLVRDLNSELAERQKTNRRLNAALDSEERLHRELIHRVKNNLSLLSALISTRRSTSTSDDVRNVLEELEHRIQAVAAVHTLLDDAGEIDFVLADDLIRSLCRQLKHSIAPPNVEIEDDLSEIMLHVKDATPLSLLVNELITNALKHAFRDRDGGKVHIALHRNGEDKLEVSVADNGSGMSVQQDGSGSGSKIVRALARQMDGELTVDGDDEKGTTWTFIFPENTRKATTDNRSRKKD